MRFNTAVSALMVLVNEMEGRIKKDDFEILLKLLSPFAPHITEELWHNMGHKKSLALEPWPQADENNMQETEVTIVVQVNGKVRGQVHVPVDSDEKAIIAQIKKDENINKWIGEAVPKKVIYVKNRLINIVI